MSDAVNIGSRRELFVDDTLIDSFDGASLKLQHPERREASFTLDSPWEDNVGLVLSVVEDEGVVRLFYRASISDMKDEDGVLVAMAESRDGGMTFERPDLGIVEFESSTRNNLLARGRQLATAPAFLDTNPDAKRHERYKGITATWQNAYITASADGLHWKLMQEDPVEMSGEFDTVNTAFWDSVSGCYRSFTRYFDNMKGPTAVNDPDAIRCIQSSTSPDFIHWSKPLPHVYRDGIEDMELYTNATVPCPGAEHIFLSFPMRYTEDRAPKIDHPLPSISDSVFMCSRDGVNWTRYCEAWVRPGLDSNNWTERSNIPVWGIVQTSETEWSMYISEHYRQADRPTRLRRLSIRPWGFVSVNVGFDGGEFATKPLVFDGSELRINYSTSGVGSVRVGVLDAEGRAIPGFSADDMNEMYGDELDTPLRWSDGGDVSRLSGQPVRLRFVLKDADVFSFRAV